MKMIPQQWSEVKLKDICTKFLNGGTPSRSEDKYWFGEIPWITGADIVNQKVAQIRRYINQEAIHNSSTNLVKKGNLLVVTRTGVGKMAIAPFNIAISQDLTGIYLDKDRADIHFIFYFFNLRVPKLESLVQGTSINGITRNQLSNQSVLLPPLLEQKKIARILRTCDRAIDLTERLIEVKEGQKKGLTQQLLTGTMRFRKFVQSDKMQQSKAGLVPEDWDVLTLKKVCLKFSNGGTPSRKIAKYWNGKIPWITGADFLEQKISTVRRFITQEAIKASSTNLIPKGSLLVVTRTGVGKLALAPFDVAISQDITGVYPKSEKVDSEYLFWYLDTFKGRLERLSQGTSINGITRDLLAKQIIPLPSLVEQRKIAAVLSACDREIEFLSKKVDVLKEQKKGLMQQLLTGKVRVEKLESCAIVHDKSY